MKIFRISLLVLALILSVGLSVSGIKSVLSPSQETVSGAHAKHAESTLPSDPSESLPWERFDDETNQYVINGFTALPGEDLADLDDWLLTGTFEKDGSDLIFLSYETPLAGEFYVPYPYNFLNLGEIGFSFVIDPEECCEFTLSLPEVHVEDPTLDDSPDCGVYYPLVKVGDEGAVYICSDPNLCVTDLSHTPTWILYQNFDDESTHRVFILFSTRSVSTYIDDALCFSFYPVFMEGIEAVCDLTLEATQTTDSLVLHDFTIYVKD